MPPDECALTDEHVDGRGDVMMRVCVGANESNDVCVRQLTHDESTPFGSVTAQPVVRPQAGKVGHGRWVIGRIQGATRTHRRENVTVDQMSLEFF